MLIKKLIYLYYIIVKNMLVRFVYLCEWQMSQLKSYLLQWNISKRSIFKTKQKVLPDGCFINRIAAFASN